MVSGYEVAESDLAVLFVPLLATEKTKGLL